MSGSSGAEREHGRLALLLGILAVAVTGGFLYDWRPPVAAEEGEGIDATITYLLVATGAILLIGHVVLWWFLSKSGNDDSPYRRPGKRAEWIWGIIPVLLMLALSEAGVLFVSGPVWDSLYVTKPQDPVIVEVVGKQFEWIVRYPGDDTVFGAFDFEFVNGADNPLGVDEDDEKALDDVVVRGMLYVPRGRAVVLKMRTHDVIHSFFVPHFRVKQDLIPGFPTTIKFTPTKTGVFELVCAELCGLGHYKMRGEVHVLEPDEFEAWLVSKPKFGG